MTATTGPDVLNGTAGDDLIDGLGGDDTINGGAGSDTLLGNNGNDTFIQDQFFLIGSTLQADNLDGGSGTDTLELRPLVGGDVNTPFGTYSAHLLAFTGYLTSVERLTFASTVSEPIAAIVPLASNTFTSVTGGGGRDYLSFIATGSGTINMPSLSLTSWSAALTNGWDTPVDIIALRADSAAGDVVTVNAAAGLNAFQVLGGGSGNDTLNGSGNADMLLGSSGTDQLFGNGGNDALGIVNVSGALAVTGAGSVFNGGAGTDLLTIGGYVDFKGTLTAMEGVNLLSPQTTGIDPIFGPFGLDSAVLELDGATLAMLPSTAIFRGTGTVVVNLADNADFDGSAFQIEGGSSVTLKVYGGLGGVSLAGTAGADELLGNTGNDTITGSSGADSIRGQGGDDRYFVSTQAALIFENSGEGEDEVVSDTGFYLYQHIENLTLASGAGNIFGVGNDLDNSLIGNEGQNLLIGGDGGDYLAGGGGIDALFGQNGVDVIHGNAGIDYLVGGADGDFLYGEADADALYGEDGADTLDGGSGFVTDILVAGIGNDALYGNSGSADYDLMDGGSGDDTYYVDTGDDLTFEALNGGTDTVRADIGGTNNGVYLYTNVENLVLLGTTAFGVGNELANSLDGNSAGNWLLGGGGSDTIWGGAGNDVLFGEGGNDRFVFESGTGGDVIGDFAQGQDRIQITGIFDTFAQAQANFVQVGNDGAINLGAGDLIVLHSVTMANLTAADFVLL